MVTDLETVIVVESIRELIGLYVHHIDRGDTEGVEQLFARDGTWEIVSDGFDAGTFTGRAAIATHFERAKAAVASDQAAYLRHHVASIRIWVCDGSARADSYWTAYTEKGPDHWGRYKDRTVWEEGRWRFSRRAVIHEGRAADGWLARQDRLERAVDASPS
jgi:hypothetical protein